MKIIDWILGLFGIVRIPAWDKATLSSNWNGSNAQERMMNIVSPLMPEDKFKARLAFMKSRGVNTAHLLITNKKDGECAGYSPFGPNFLSYKVDKNFAKVMTKRIKYLHNEGLAIVLWLMADDSNDWANDVASDLKKAKAYCKAVKDLGWFKYTSTVVVGLEMNEYWNAAQAGTMATALKECYKGKIGTHHTSGQAPFAGLGDILFYQIEPGASIQKVASETKKALGFGKPVNFFELQRNPNRTLCQTAMNNGAFGCGNW